MRPGGKLPGFPANVSLQDFLKCKVNEKKAMTKTAFFNKLDTYGHVFFSALAPIIDLFSDV